MTNRRRHAPVSTADALSLALGALVVLLLLTRCGVLLP